MVNRVCSLSGAMITYRQFDRIHRRRILDVEAVDDMAAAEALVEHVATSAAATPNEAASPRSAEIGGCI